MTVRYYDEDWNQIEEPAEVSDFLYYEEDDDWLDDRLSCGCCSCCGCDCDDWFGDVDCECEEDD